MGIDILGIDIVGVDILGIDNPAPTRIERVHTTIVWYTMWINCENPLICLLLSPIDFFTDRCKHLLFIL